VYILYILCVDCAYLYTVLGACSVHTGSLFITLMTELTTFEAVYTFFLTD